MNNILLKDGSIESVANLEDALDIIRESLGGEICDYINSCMKSVSDDVNALIYYLNKVDHDSDSDYYKKSLTDHIADCKTKYKYNYS